MFRGEAASAATILRHGGLWVRQVETRYYLTPGQPRRQRKEILSRAEDSSNTGLAGSAERIEVHCNGQGVPGPYPFIAAQCAARRCRPSTTRSGHPRSRRRTSLRLTPRAVESSLQNSAGRNRPQRCRKLLPPGAAEYG